MKTRLSCPHFPFTKLQVLASCCSALAHGGNDIANAISPLTGVYLLYAHGPADTITKTPWWLSLYGGLFISFGIFIYGKRCIETMGNSITKIMPSSGVTTEIMAVCVVQVCSVFGFPVSTTHCQVGAVIGIGER